MGKNPVFTGSNVIEQLRDFFLRLIGAGNEAALLRDNRRLRMENGRLLQMVNDTAREGRSKIAEFRKEHAAAVSKLAKQASLHKLAIGILEGRLKEMEQWSLKDPLTGLLNRRGATEQLIATASTLWHSDDGVGQPINKRMSCSVVFVDLDNFKPVNDRFGHARGDEVLKRVAQLLHESFPRKGDIIARIGGDEFVVVMANAGIEAAGKRSDILLRKMSDDIALSVDGLHVGASIGVSFLMLSPTTGGLKSETVLTQLDQAIEEADAAMYLSKKSGKGQVTIHDR